LFGVAGLVWQRLKIHRRQPTLKVLVRAAGQKMILDTIDNAHLYFGLGARIEAALRFLWQRETFDLKPAELGGAASLRHPIEGDAIFALIQRYNTKLPAGAFWEAHRKYIDVQYVVEGVEMMGWSNLADMRVTQEYDAEKDYTILESCKDRESTNFLRVPAGSFAIFMPHDAHMPGLMADGAVSMVKKIVVKVSVEQT